MVTASKTSSVAAAFPGRFFPEIAANMARLERHARRVSPLVSITGGGRGNRNREAGKGTSGPGRRRSFARRGSLDHGGPGAPYACAVPLPLESVPNFSEGRDGAVVDALRDALSGPARLLDVHVDPDHNRSVYTLVGSGEELVESLFTGINAAVDRIDLGAHVGAHPRIGAADVVPLIPIRPEDEPLAREAALALADRLGDELELPVFFYGRLTEDGREPAFFRRGGPEELQRRMDAGELAPDRGPSRLHPTAGGVVLGVRQAVDRVQREPALAGRRLREGDRAGSCGSGTAGTRASAPSVSTCPRPGSCRSA